MNRVFLAAGLFFSATAFPETESLVSVPSLEEPSEEIPSAPAALPSQSQEIASEIQPSSPVNRPWSLQTPAGATAFVLDRGEFELSAGSEILGARLRVPGSILEVRYGISDSLTFGFAGNISFGQNVGNGVLLVPELKWNFLNTENWVYSLRPRAGFRFGQSLTQSYSLPAKDRPLMLEIAASQVITDQRRLHLSVSAGTNQRRSTYDYGNDYSYYYYYSAITDDTYKTARISAAYEIKFKESHSFTLSFSPTYFTSDSKSSDSGSYYFYGSKNSDQKIGAMLGIGYGYFSEKFGAMVGIEGGPTWTSYQYGYSYMGATQSYESTYSSFQWFGLSQGNFSLTYRI